MTANDIVQQQEQLSSLTVRELRQELEKALSITAEHLQYLAAVWRELESRGEDLSHLRIGLAGYLPMIANGRIEPRLVVQYAGRKTILSALSRLPFEEQRRIADDAHVTLVTLDEKGNRQDLQRPIDQLGQGELYQVITEDGIRSPDKQFLMLANRTPRKTSKKNVIRKIKAERIDGDNFFRFGTKRIKEANLLAELAQHYGVPEEDVVSVFRANGLDHAGSRKPLP